MAFQMVRNFFGQRSPSRSRVHEPIIESEAFLGQEGLAHYDQRDVGKSANELNWPQLARQGKEADRAGRKPHINNIKSRTRVLNSTTTVNRTLLIPNVGGWS